LLASRSRLLHFEPFSAWPGHTICAYRPMDNGRLIRAGRYRGDPHAVAYIVAIADAAAAIELVRKFRHGHGHEIEDIGRVSHALLQAFSIMPGEFVRADAPREHFL